MADTGTIINPDTIRFERVMPGPLIRLWDHLTVRELLATWLADAAIEKREGGKVELRFDIEEVPARKRGGAVIRGVVTCWDPPRALAYSWVDVSIDHQSPGSVVGFALEAHGQDVLLDLTHRQLPITILPKFGAGWHTHLDVLRARLQGQEPEPFLEVFSRVLPVYERAASSFSVASADPA